MTFRFYCYSRIIVHCHALEFSSRNLLNQTVGSLGAYFQLINIHLCFGIL